MAIVFFSCSKNAKPCEDNNTFTLKVENTSSTGVLGFNIDKDFVSVNTPGDYTVPQNSSLEVDVSAGSHVIKARLIVSSCSGGRCSISVTGKADKDVNSQSCNTTTLVY